MEIFLDVAKGLNKRFPDGNQPFQIITRLAEECGELAREVNVWEGTGIKRQKHGAPSKEKLAGEVKNVLTCALQVALYYEVEEELSESIRTSYLRLQSEGHLK